jgi:hypothetical protein
MKLFDPIIDQSKPEFVLAFRIFSFIACLVFVFNLFHLGTQPVAVGLFVTPIDKIAHAGVFALLAMLLWFVFDRKYPFLVIVLAAIIGATDEIHQLNLPGRFADVNDWLADVGGACLPLLVLTVARKMKVNLGSDSTANETFT